jgi:hypothetical protein
MFAYANGAAAPFSKGVNLDGITAEVTGDGSRLHQSPV